MTAMATLADVAQRAQVSKTTASRVLNGLAERYRITSATVKLVEDAAKALGYRPSYAARALTRGRTDNIGVLLGFRALASPAVQTFVGAVLGGINEIVRPSGRHVVLTSERERFETLGGLAINPSDRFDALIAFGYVLSPEFTAIDLEHLDAPLVVVGEPPVPTRRPAVFLDAEPGLEAAVDHLRERGHTSIAWVSLAHSIHDVDARPREDSQARARMVSRLCAARGMTCVVVSAGISAPIHQLGRDRALTALMESLAPIIAGLHGVTALCCYNDLVAHAAIRLLRRLGRPVPEDMAVIGFDNLFADLADPPLTTVDHCLAEMGRRAAALALQMVDDPASRTGLAGHRELVPARLVVREST